jgi:hypothetical protein
MNIHHLAYALQYIDRASNGRNDARTDSCKSVQGRYPRNAILDGPDRVRLSALGKQIIRRYAPRTAGAPAH